MPKKYVYIFLGIIVLVSVFLLFKSRQRNLGLNKTQNQKLPETKTKVEQVPSDKLPPKLPENLPIEKEVGLLRNEIVETSVGEQVSQTEYVRHYFSKKTVKQNYEIYQKYFKDNGWKILFSQSQEVYANLVAQKTKEEKPLSVQVSKNTITGDVSVSISYVE